MIIGLSRAKLLEGHKRGNITQPLTIIFQHASLFTSKIYLSNLLSKKNQFPCDYAYDSNIFLNLELDPEKEHLRINFIEWPIV